MIVGDDLYELLWCARHSQEDMTALTAVTGQISAFEALAERLGADPVLAQAWKRQERIMDRGSSVADAF